MLQKTLGGRSVYERDYGYPRHDHFYCQVCNGILWVGLRRMTDFATAWLAFGPKNDKVVYK